MFKNTKAKGSRAERKTIRFLEAQGFRCTKAGGSLGVWDLIAIGPETIKLVQVKSGSARASRKEKEAMQVFPCPPCATKELWTWKDYARKAQIEIL